MVGFDTPFTATLGDLLAAYRLVTLAYIFQRNFTVMLPEISGSALSNVSTLKSMASSLLLTSVCEAWHGARYHSLTATAGST